MSNSLKDDPRIKIDGVDGIWILMNDGMKLGDNGAIATQKIFDGFKESYAHMNDGVIRRYHNVIADKTQWHYVEDNI